MHALHSVMPVVNRCGCRKLVFDELLDKAKDKAAKEEKRRKRAREDFTALLRETRAVNFDSSWEDIKPSLESASEYKAV